MGALLFTSPPEAMPCPGTVTDVAPFIFGAYLCSTANTRTARTTLAIVTMVAPIPSQLVRPSETLKILVSRKGTANPPKRQVCGLVRFLTSIGGQPTFGMNHSTKSQSAKISLALVLSKFPKKGCRPVVPTIFAKIVLNSICRRSSRFGRVSSLPDIGGWPRKERQRGRNRPHFAAKRSRPQGDDR